MSFHIGMNELTVEFTDDGMTILKNNIPPDPDMENTISLNASESRELMSIMHGARKIAEIDPFL